MTYQPHAEYDAFGPWIHEIGQKHALPPLFASYQRAADASLMMIKIPRHLERRNANPDMHLYDTVVGVMDDHLLILDREGDTVSEQRVAIADIQAIQKTTDLLAGELMLYTPTRVAAVAYNTVSDDVISRMVALIRGMWTHPDTALPLSPLPYNFNTVDFLYANLIGAMQKADPSVNLVAYQPRLSLAAQNIWQRILAWLTNRSILQCTAYLTDARDLIVIRRSQSVRAADLADYAYTYTYVPLSIITDAHITPHRKMDSLSQLVYRTADHAFTSVFSDANTGVEALCDALGGIHE